MRKIMLEVTLTGDRDIVFHTDEVQTFTRTTFFGSVEDSRSMGLTKDEHGNTVYRFNGEDFDLFTVRPVIVKS